MTHHSHAGYGLRDLLTVLLTTRVCVCVYVCCYETKTLRLTEATLGKNFTLKALDTERPAVPKLTGTAVRSTSDAIKR